MSKRSDYARQMTGVSDPVSFLRRHSGLPGPRGNLELVQAAADTGSEADFRNWIAAGAGDDPSDEFLVVCGVVGLGRLLAEGRSELAEELRAHAADERWRVREGVAMALQRVGDVDSRRLFDMSELWACDRPYVQRAAAAAVAEPRLLEDREAAMRAVALVDRITECYAASSDRRSAESRTLRQGLGYCWSVVVAACPDEGMRRFEHWVTSREPDVRWVLRENLKKARLIRLDPDWVEEMRKSLTDGPAT